MTKQQVLASNQVLLYCDHPCFSSHTKVAGLTLLQRAILNAHKAGIEKFYIVEQEPGEKESLGKWLEKQQKITGQWQWISSTELPTHAPSILLYNVSVILTPAALEEFLAKAALATQASNSHEELELALVSGQELTKSFSKLPLSKISLENFALSLPKDIAWAEKMLLEASSSPLEGMVDVYFNRPLGRMLTLPLVRGQVNPNSVSFFSLALGLLAALCFLGSYWQALLGALLLQLAAVIDCIDGDVARLQHRESRLGYWLDMAGDNVVHLAIFAGLSYKLYQWQPGQLSLLLGGLLLAATVISFSLVTYFQVKLKSKWQSYAVGEPGVQLQKFIEKMTSRDFTLLLIFLACCGRVELFLYPAAIGSQVFWVLLLFSIVKTEIHLRKKVKKVPARAY